MKNLLAIILIILVIPVSAYSVCQTGWSTGTVCNVMEADGSTPSGVDTDVEAAIAQVSDGDTVQVPTGSYTWDTDVDFQADTAVILTGSGNRETIITIGIDSMIDLQHTDSVIKNFHFVYPAGTGFDIMIHATGQGWRITDNFFDNQAGTSQISVQADGFNTLGLIRPWGLIDHNILGDTKLQALGTALIDNTSWNEASGLGDKFTVYVENNTIARTQANALAVDSNYGGGYVFRYNTVTDAEALAHGLQGANRATRRWEVYRNSFIYSAYGALAGFMRGGTGVWFGNRLTGAWPNSYIKIDNERSCTSKTTSLQCDGTSPWDENVGAGDAAGYRCRDQIGASTDTVKWVSTEGSEGEFTQTTDPAYAWDNYMGATSVEFQVAGNCAAETAHIVSGRDFVNNGDTPKPGYTAYQFPHPLDTEHAGWELTSADCTGNECLEAGTPPTLLSATIDETGSYITFRGSENLVPTISTGFALTLSGGAATATYSSGSGTAYLVYSLSRTVASGETGTYDYTQPGNGIEDSSGNDLASITGGAITNNSTSGAASIGSMVMSGAGSMTGIGTGSGSMTIIP